jgi:putative holliday junction resolvase
MKLFGQVLDTVHPNKLMEYLLCYLDQEEVETIVVGHPKQMNNEDSDAFQHIKPFIRQLKKHFPDIPVELEDERFTSRMAQDAMIRGGMKKKQRQNKAHVDQVSAVILLQSFLERKKINQP